VFGAACVHLCVWMARERCGDRKWGLGIPASEVWSEEPGEKRGGGGGGGGGGKFLQVPTEVHVHAGLNFFSTLSTVPLRGKSRS
jgi:hypothetical protein